MFPQTYNPISWEVEAGGSHEFESNLDARTCLKKQGMETNGKETKLIKCLQAPGPKLKFQMQFFKKEQTNK